MSRPVQIVAPISQLDGLAPFITTRPTANSTAVGWFAKTDIYVLEN